MLDIQEGSKQEQDNKSQSDQVDILDDEVSDMENDELNAVEIGRATNDNNDIKISKMDLGDDLDDNKLESVDIHVLESQQNKEQAKEHGEPDPITEEDKQKEHRSKLFINVYIFIHYLISSNLKWN